MNVNEVKEHLDFLKANEKETDIENAIKPEIVNKKKKKKYKTIQDMTAKEFKRVKKRDISPPKYNSLFKKIKSDKRHKGKSEVLT